MTIDDGAVVGTSRGTGPGRKPRDDLELDVTVVCAQVLGIDDLGPDDDLWEAGLDSLAAVELAAECASLGWGAYETTSLIEDGTPAGIADRLRADARRDLWTRTTTVVELNPDGTQRPIVAIPGAGGTAFSFAWLARALGDDQPVIAIEAAGVHTRQPPDRTLTAMADRAAATTTEVVPDGPVTLIGHSLGGVIAYEVAQRLSATGREVRLVMIDAVLDPAGLRVGAVGPATPSGRPRRGVLRRAARAAVRSPRSLVRRLITGARVRVRVRWPGPPTGSTTRYEAFILIGGQAIRGYRPASPTFSVLHLHIASAAAARDWAQTVDLTSAVVPGDHFTVLKPPNVALVAERVRAVHDDGGPAGA